MLNWRWKLFETAFTVIKYSLFGSESQSCLATLPLVVPTPCSYLTMYILFICIIIRHICIYIYIMYIIMSTYGYLLLKLLLLSMLMQIMVSCVNSLDFIARRSPALSSPFLFVLGRCSPPEPLNSAEWVSNCLHVSVCLLFCRLMVQWRRGHNYVTCLYRQEVVWWCSKLIMHTAGGLLSCLAGVPPTRCASVEHEWEEVTINLHSSLTANCIMTATLRGWIQSCFEVDFWIFHMVSNVV